MRKIYKSTRLPILEEQHLPVRIQSATAFPTNTASWNNRKDAIERIKTNCFKSFGKCKLTIMNTEEQEVVDYVKDRIEQNDKVPFSPEEVAELKTILAKKIIKK